MQHRAIHMLAIEVAGAAVAVEQRVEDAFGQRGREKQRVALQGAQYQGLQLARGLAALGELLVVLLFDRLLSGAGGAGFPGFGVGQQLAGLCQFIGSQNAGNV